MQPDDAIFHKPKSFIAAKNLLYASLFLSLINVIIHNILLKISSNYLVLAWVMIAIGFVVIIVFIKQMGLCKKWARTVLLILLSIGFLGVCFSMIRSLINPRAEMDIIEVALWAVKTVLQIIAFIFLYGKECENWFNSKKYELFPEEVGS